MEALKKIREMCEDELKDLMKKGELKTMGNLEIANKLTDTIKNIDKIEMLETEGGHSQAGYARAGEWTADMRGNYGRGNSYADRAMYDREDSRAYDDGMSRRRDSMGRYSRGGDMAEQLRSMMDEAGSEREREAIRTALRGIEGR